MAVSIYSTATEYIANAITLTRGHVSDIVSVGIYVNTAPNVIPTVAQFTTVTLVDGTAGGTLPPLAVAGEIDVLTKVGPGSAPVAAGDLSTLTPGSYQVWILIKTASEAIIRKVDTLTIQLLPSAPAREGRAVNPDIFDGWLRVAYDGPDLAVIEMEAAGTGWLDAYLDYRDGRRVAQIRWDGPLPDAIYLRVDGVLTATWP